MWSPRHKMGRFLTVAALLSLAAAAAQDLAEVQLFRAGEGGYHTYRIPALIATRRGTLLAFAEGRRGSSADSGDIDVVLKRSFDNGRTWSALQVVADLGGDTVGNPAPVVDRTTGTIILLLTRNPGQVTEKQIVDGTAEGTRTVWITRSHDDGATWEPPAEITSAVKRDEWSWYATGPGNGVQLRSGRLVIPCDHIRKDNRAMHSHVILSDDGGATWRIGGVAAAGTNESAVAELRDGSLVLNMRSYAGKQRRAVARSRDGGETWSAVELDDALIEPVCQASLITARGGRLLFSNPAATTRSKMTVRLSRDGGRTWPVSRLVWEGPAAYSSLAVLRDRSVGLLYERGERRPYDSIVFARFRMAWLTK